MSEDKTENGEPASDSQPEAKPKTLFDEDPEFKALAYKYLLLTERFYPHGNSGSEGGGCPH